MSVKTQPAIISVADRVFAARQNRETIPPVRTELPPKDVAAAYAIQRVNVARLVASGRRRVGRKIGLTSQAVQQQLGVDIPDFGVLFDFMAFRSSAVPVGQLISPRIEAEFALLLGCDVTEGDLEPGQLAGCVEAVAASVEIVDSVTNWDIDIVDTIADNASSGGFVTAPWRPFTRDQRLSELCMRLLRHGEVVSQGAGSSTLGDPLNALAWLARTSIADGDPLRAGEIVLSGALGPMKALTPGDYVVEIDSFEPLFVRAVA